MDEFRKEVRGAFDRSWARRPDSDGLEGRLSRALAADASHRGKVRLHRVLATVAALAIAAIAVLGVGLNLSRLSVSQHGPGPLPVGPRPVSPSPTEPSPSPSLPPEVDYGVPPAGVPLVLYADPRNLSWIVAVDWSGKPRGTIKLSGSHPDAMSFVNRGAAQSPDGSRLLLGGSVYDRFGNSLGQLKTTGIAYWADDNRHLCGAEYSGGVATQYLSTYLPGTSGQRLFKVGTSAFQDRADPIICSFASGIALVGQGFGEDHDISAFRLSSGAVTFHRAYGPGPGPLNPVATHDGKYLAESTFKQGAHSVIRETTRGLQLASLADVAVLGFSGDGKLVVTIDGTQGAGSNQKVQVVDWRSGRVVWTSPDVSLALTDILPQPNGSALALAMSPASGNGPPPGQPLEQLLIISPDGSSVRIGDGLVSAWGGIKPIPGG